MGFLPVRIQEEDGRYYFVVPEEVEAVTPADNEGKVTTIHLRSGNSIQMRAAITKVVTALQGKRYS